jgi:hypothetical protein
MEAKDLAQALGRTAMAARLDVGLTAISNATVRGKFPAQWFAVLKQMADEAGVECPMCLFSFVSAPANSRHGDAASPLHPPHSEQTVSESDPNTATDIPTAAR